LAHPNIIEVYDCGMTDDGSSYYVMEYLPGLDLEHLVARAGPLPPGRTVALLRQVCAALRSAHRVGLVHRDVKPSNVMICGSPGRCDLAKLLDFGLVRPVRGGAMNPLNLTIPGHVIGTPDYMSPEQAVGVTDIDIRADLYALGGLAYFMLTGRPPFVRDTPLAALTAHAYEVPEPPSRLRSDVPFDLEVVVLRCLAKSPNDRFESAADVERALAKCRCANDWSTTDAEQWWEQQNEESPSASNNTLASALGR
jgi:serine/threonine-protein kinase